MGSAQVVLVLFLVALCSSGVFGFAKLLQPEELHGEKVGVKLTDDNIPLVNINRWGGCGWKGRPCFVLQIVSDGSVQHIAVDKIPSVQVKDDEIKLKF